MSKPIAICIIGNYSAEKIAMISHMLKSLGNIEIKPQPSPFADLKPEEFKLMSIKRIIPTDIVDIPSIANKKKNRFNLFSSLNQSVDVKYRQLLRAQYKQALRVRR